MVMSADNQTMEEAEGYGSDRRTQNAVRQRGTAKFSGRAKAEGASEPAKTKNPEKMPGTAREGTPAAGFRRAGMIFVLALTGMVIGMAGLMTAAAGGHQTQLREYRSENLREQESGAVTQTAFETEAGEEPQTEYESESESESWAEKFAVAIDPGHQGSWVDMSEPEPSAPGSSEMKAKSTTGTQGRFSGKPEYELNLEVSLLLREELEERGYEVILTREDNDTAISNAERAAMAYEEGGDIYVRIHANGVDDSGVNGALAMVPSAQNPYVGDLAEESRLLADCVLNAYCEKAGFASLGIQYYDNMTGINWSRLPVMILEMGFMTNESDDLRMADASVQELMAEGIADGVDAYFQQRDVSEE